MTNPSVDPSVDPEAFLLVSWNRISQWSAIPKGQLLASGESLWTKTQRELGMKPR